MSGRPVLTSRERVTRALNYQPIDRVPIDLGGMKATGIAVKAYNAVKKQIGLATPTRIWDPKFMIAHVEEEVRQRFHLDVVPLDVSSVSDEMRPEEEWVPMALYDGAEGLMPPGTMIEKDDRGRWVLMDADGKPTALRMPREGYYFDDISFDRPGMEIRPSEFRPEATFSDEQLRAVEARAGLLFCQTDYAVLGWGGGVCFLGLSLITDKSSNVTMGCPTHWMTMLITEKELCHEMMGRSVEAAISRLSLLHEAVGNRCVAWGIAADDAGTQRGEFIRPDLWAEMIKPHYARLCAWVHAHTRWKTFLHSCGSVYYLIPHMIEAGIDILNPVQTSAANMEPERLTREFGGKLVFWGGGCDTQHVLGSGSPEEVRTHVRERLERFKAGGGYVFTQVHNIQPNVPPENILAMLDAAHEYGVC